MFLKKIITISVQSIRTNASLYLACLVVIGYLAVLNCCTGKHSHETATDNRLTRTAPVTLRAVPEVTNKTKSINSGKIVQTGGYSPTKYLSFDDFMQTYSQDPKPASLSPQVQEKSFDFASQPAVEKEVPVKKVSSPVQQIPATDDFSAFMETQPKKQENAPLPPKQELKQEKPKAALLLPDFGNSTIPTIQPSVTTQNVVIEDPDAPKLLISETAQSLKLPQTVVKEIIREEANSPGGLDAQQVRKLIAMMIREATELKDLNKPLEASRLSRFALFVADEAGLTKISNDPELVSMLYLAKTLQAGQSDSFNSAQPVTEPVKETIAKPASPVIIPEPATLKQHAKANEAMVLPGYANNSVNTQIQHPVNPLVRTNPFQSAAYTNQDSQPVSKNQEFKPFETSPKLTSSLPQIPQKTSSTEYLAFPEMDAPLPPGDAQNSHDAFADQTLPEFQNGISVKDNLVQIPEHVTYGIMLGMFIMIVLLFIRRR